MIRAASLSISALEKYVLDALVNGCAKIWINILIYFLIISKNTWKKYVLTTQSCTSAIHLALHALNKKGDEIIVWFDLGSFCFPITYLEAKPAFVDVDKESLCLSVESLKKN